MCMVKGSAGGKWLASWQPEAERARQELGRGQTLSFSTCSDFYLHTSLSFQQQADCNPIAFCKSHLGAHEALGDYPDTNCNTANGLPELSCSVSSPAAEDNTVMPTSTEEESKAHCKQGTGVRFQRQNRHNLEFAFVLQSPGLGDSSKLLFMAVCIVTYKGGGDPSVCLNIELHSLFKIPNNLWEILRRY